MKGVFPLFLRLQSYPVKRAEKELFMIHNMAPEARAAFLEKKRWEIVRFHFNDNEFYRKKVGRYLPDKWEDLPIITKQDLQQPLKQMLPQSLSLRNCYSGSTSGASGIPFRFVKDKFTHAMTWAVISHRYRQHGIYLHERSARFYGIPKELSKYAFEKIKDTVLNRRRFTVFDLSDKIMEQWLNIFKKDAFRLLYGYTSVLVLFARYILNKGIVLKDTCPTIALCISTSETSTEEDHFLLEHAFGVRHIREYGISETCITGFDMPYGQMLLTDETLYNEAIDERGTICVDKEGTLLSTSLYNTALPMIRYEVGDKVTLSVEGNTNCIKKLSGRTNDIIFLPDGKKAAGLTFYYVARSILEPTGVLKEFIVRQLSLCDFALDIVSTREFTLAEMEVIKRKIALYLHPDINIIVNRCDRIERTAAGKLKHFYSELTY